MPGPMQPDPVPPSETRLLIPLQTGTSALREMLLGLVLSTVMLIFGGLMVIKGPALEVVPIIGGFVAIGPLLVGLVSLQRRAVDVELRQSEFIVRGGPLDRRTVRYADLDPKRVEVVREEPTPDGGSSLPYAHLDLFLRDGTFLRLASIVDQGEERLFLEELCGIILDLAGPTEPAVAGPGAADMAACAACGRPLVPQDVPSVTCPSCHQPAVMPEALRQRIRENQAVKVFDDETCAAAKSLLRQPSAWAINLMLVAWIAVGVAAPFLAIWGIAARLFSVVFVAYALLHGLYSLIRLVLTRRAPWSCRARRASRWGRNGFPPVAIVVGFFLPIETGGYWSAAPTAPRPVCWPSTCRGIANANTQRWIGHLSFDEATAFGPDR